MKVQANGIAIEVEDSATGDASHRQRPAVLLIMGLGMQLIAWPPDLVQGLLAAGYRVLRHDNRDIGLSQHFDHLGLPNIMWASLRFRLGLPVHSAYTLSDMADDAVGVLDALGVAQAHVVGVSMGGMIAQRLALRAPARVHSLSSIMSTSGARDLPQPGMTVLRAMMRRPASARVPDVVDHYVRLLRVIGSPAFALPEAELRQRIQAGIERSYHPAGTLRQMVAVAADSARAAELHRIRCRTLVLHGTIDPLIPIAGGRDTARRIPGARFEAIAGMGHDLPPGVVQRLLPPLLQHMKSA